MNEIGEPTIKRCMAATRIGRLKGHEPAEYAVLAKPRVGRIPALFASRRSAFRRLGHG